MFKEEMKSLIKFSMEKNISGLETKVGYNGAPILRISSQNFSDLKKIQKWCDNLGYKSVIHNSEAEDTPEALKNYTGYNLFCVFGEDTINSDIFELKLD